MLFAFCSHDALLWLLRQVHKWAYVHMYISCHQPSAACITERLVDSTPSESWVVLSEICKG